MKHTLRKILTIAVNKGHEGGVNSRALQDIFNVKSRQALDYKFRTGAIRLYELKTVAKKLGVKMIDLIDDRD